MLDQTSLLVAIAFAATGLMLTLLLSWMGAKQQKYLLCWGAGLAFIVLGTVTFGIFDDYLPPLQLGSFVLLLTGFALVYAGTAQFRTGTLPVPLAFGLWVAATGATGLAFAFGLSGLGTIIANFGCATFFLLAGHEYWLGRRESPRAMLLMTILYVLSAASFLLCGLVLLAGGQFVLTARPSNWAEELNAIIVILALAGIGAMALTLSQTRTAQRHRREAMTDSLTRLLNRRAVFDLVGTEQLPGGTAVVMFDLDRFKIVNDRFGHAMGDDILRRFALILASSVRPGDLAARLGGEEFCLVLSSLTAHDVLGVAERVRAEFARTAPLDEEFGSPTVSAGIAVAPPSGAGFDQLLREADDALYKAKNDGRNRIHGPVPRLAA